MSSNAESLTFSLASKKADTVAQYDGIQKLERKKYWSCWPSKTEASFLKCKFWRTVGRVI
jgi:hypothetical protein